MRLLREKPRPFIYAVLVHLLLLAVLVFSLDWETNVKPAAERNKAPVQAVVVDASKLDAEIERRKKLEEQKLREQRAREAEKKRLADLKRKQEQEAKRKKAEAKRQAEAKKKAAAEKKRKAELAAKKKAEEEKKRKAEAERKRKEEAKRKAEAERKRKEEAKRKAEAERKRKEEEKRKAEAERKRKEEAKRKAEAERRRKAAEQELQARLAAEQKRLAAQRQSAMQRMINEYVLYIQEKVQRSWIRPPGSSSALSCTVQVRLVPGGEVVDAQIVRSSGNPAFDRSVEAAVFKASPLPVPPDREVMEQFRSLRFEFRPG